MVTTSMYPVGVVFGTAVAIGLVLLLFRFTADRRIGDVFPLLTVLEEEEEL